MLLLYYTHSVLFYIGLSSFQPHNDFKKPLHSFDYDYLPQEVCVAKCLKNGQVTKMAQTPQLSNQFMKTCMDNCSSVSHTNLTKVDNITPPQEIRENYSLNLICRDDSSLNFKIDLNLTNKNSKLYENQSNSSVANFNSTQLCLNTNTSNNASNEVEENQCQYRTLFVIKNHLANEADKIFVYLSDDNFFTIDKLASNTTYNISVLAVHSTNKYSIVAQHQQFKTLRRSYTPGNIKEIKITHFTEDKLDKMHLTATLTWKPATDRTCHYNIICFSPESEDYDLQPLEIRNPRQLYKHQLENLTFSSVYKVGIRASNTKSMRESELFWKTFTVPSCVQWHNYNFNICAPESPQNLNVEETVIDQHVYSLNITWQLPTHLPDNYTLRIQDLSVQGEVSTYNLAKDINSFFVPKIYFYGMFYDVTLTAFTRGGSAKASFSDIIRTVVHVPEKTSAIKLIAVVLVATFCIAIVSISICIIYNRRAKLKRYQERCKYFEELEKKAPVEPKNNFDFNMSLLANGSNLINDQNYMPYDDDMEIDVNNLILFEVLGEGAFGLVRRGLYSDSKLGVDYLVAVKMLKDHPSTDDIHAFRREIEVMKSVEKHPNIVGIIGHCTRFSHQMMLITEYCSFGNLLNFLREEWNFQQKMQATKEGSKENVTYIELKQEDNISQYLHAENNLVQPTVHHDCIQIRDCDCKMNENCCNRTNKFNSVVENKSYFLLPTSEHKYLPTTNPNTIDSTKMEYEGQLQPQGTLESYINEEEADESYMNATANDLERKMLSLEDLLHIARQVAVGMEFLAKNKVVHRDLAARNVLVAPDKTIKIADFGLSRDVYQENMYRKTGNGKLPIKWLALESMTHQVYTTQSDVWSYGILLYEIVTLGSTPYPSIPTNRLLDLLKSGYRMEKPQGCQPELYDLMYSCWKMMPEERPSFNIIIQKLDELLRSVDNRNSLLTSYFEVDKDIGNEEEEEEEESTYEVDNGCTYLNPL